MNTNKFLLGGLVAVIAIVSVQISNQLLIQDLIEKVDSVAIPQQAAVITALDTKTITPPLLIENTCLKTTINQSFGTNMKQAVEQKISIMATCDKTTINDLVLGFSSSSQDVLKKLQIKDSATGKIYPVETKEVRQFKSTTNQTSFGVVSKIPLEISLAKNATRTFSLTTLNTDVQMNLAASTITSNGIKSLISYTNYGPGNGGGPLGIPIWLLNAWCDTFGGPWTANGGAYTCSDAVF
jgi:hypothetical protein